MTTDKITTRFTPATGPSALDRAIADFRGEIENSTLTRNHGLSQKRLVLNFLPNRLQTLPNPPINTNKG